MLKFILINFFFVGFLLSCFNKQNVASKNQAKPTTVNQLQDMKNQNLEVATLGGGCFWCVEAVYQRLNGVVKVESGYAGGHVANPTYKQVCNGTTGHAEVIQVTFDPKIVSFKDILEVFWHVHDPTTLNRQGNDVGTQYRSIIFYHNDEQRAIAENSKKATDDSKLWPNPVVTAIEPFANYYAAENYHQNYFNENGSEPYCSYVIAPKIQKFLKQFKDKLKPETPH